MRLRLLDVSLVTVLLCVIVFGVPHQIFLQREIDANDLAIKAAVRAIDLRGKRLKLATWQGGSLSLQDPDGRLIDVEFSPPLTGTIDAIHVGPDDAISYVSTGSPGSIVYGDRGEFSGEIRLSGGTSR